MAKIINTTQSRPIVVDTQYAPPSTNFYIQNVGEQSLEQWYDAVKGIYKPDRASTSPLVLKPVLSIYDPDGILPNNPTSFKKVEWREIVETNGTSTDNGNVTDIPDTVVIGGETVRVYTQNTGGTLTVRRNVPDGTSYRLRCKLIYTDPRTGYDMKFQSDVVLITNRTENPPYSLVYTTQSSIEYHPLLNEVDSRTNKVIVNNITFGVNLYQGETLQQTAKYFWYWTDSTHPNGVLVDDSTNPLLAYVSGQGTSTLTINPEMTDGLTLMVRASADSSATAPDIDLRQYFALNIIFDPIESDTVCFNGDRLMSDMSSMTFQQIVKVKGRDIDDAVRKKYLRTRWYHKTTSSRTTIEDGYSDEITHSRSTLVSSQGDSVQVFAQIEGKGGYKIVVDNDGKVVTESGAIVIERD